MPKCGRRTDLPVFETGVGGLMAQEYVNRNAPFGTNYTPTVRTKIIGGVPRQVKETQRSFQHPALEPVSPQRTTHPDSVQDFDAHVKMMKSKQQNERQSLQQTPSSPDWRSRPVLPPIQSNNQTPQQSHHNTQHGSQTQTSVANHGSQSVNPHDSYQQNYQNYNSQTQYQQPAATSNQYRQPSPIKQIEPTYEPRDYKNHGAPRDHQWKPAAGYSYLPTQPIALSKDQEIFLMHKLAEDLAGCSLEQVKAVYEDMAANDRALTGMGSYSDLGIFLQKQGIYPNLNTLRLLASTCVSTKDIGYVDYEKLLSFLLAAVRKSKEFPNQEPAVFYSHRNENQDPYGSQHDPVRSDGQLYRLIQQELLRAKATVNIEELRKMFGKADRLFRLTLSQPQITEICRSVKLPLSDAVIDRMLEHCETHGDGQYVWTGFVELLEKVQPHATGLPIPESKRPLEYARKYRKPTENWPHPNPAALEPAAKIPLMSRRDDPVQHELLNRQSANMLPPPHSQELNAPVAARTLQHQNISAPAGSHGRLVTDSQVSPRGLGVQNHNKPWSKEQHDTWFEGFRKLAEALYRHDLDRQGSMKQDQCRWLITEYNDIYDLRLDGSSVDHCINRNTTNSGTEIDGLLQSLLSLRD